MKRTGMLLVLALTLSLLISSCSGGDVPQTSEGVQTEPVSSMDLWTLDINDYVALCEYSGQTIKHDSPTASRGAVVWKYVIENSEIKAYPEQQLKYYFNQIKAKYIYFANSGEMGYSELLAKLGISSEEVLWDEARALLREDLILHALIIKENVSLTDVDKQNYFEKYVKKYVEDYGYKESYVRENMTGEIYNSMLYDKVIEKLISMNEFVLEGGEG